MSKLRLCGIIVHFHLVLKVCRVITYWNIQVKNTQESWVVDGVVASVVVPHKFIHVNPPLFARRMGRLKLLALVEILYPHWQP